jgi:hypothetical protein
VLPNHQGIFANKIAIERPVDSDDTGAASIARSEIDVDTMNFVPTSMYPCFVVEQYSGGMIGCES